MESKAVDMSQKYRISSGFVLRQIAGEYIIVPIDGQSEISNAIMTPNDTAGFLWKEFSEPSSMEQVISRVVTEYEGSEEEIREDVIGFVEQSVNLGILVEVD